MPNLIFPSVLMPELRRGNIVPRPPSAVRGMKRPRPNRCTIKIFMVGGGRSGGWRGGSLRNNSKNILKQRVGKTKSCLLGEESWKCHSLSIPPPQKNFNRTLGLK